MVHVLASIRVKPGCREAFLAIFKANVPAVLAEAGCHGYQPAVDLESGMPPQILEPNTVVIIEKWASLEALRAHLAAPHMKAYKEKTKDMVDGVSLKILQNA
jgi:quinol monooxygenase YgiN